MRMNDKREYVIQDWIYFFNYFFFEYVKVH